jgi:hypothetical protein
VQIGVVSGVEAHDLDRTTERRRFPDDFLVRGLRQRAQGLVYLIIRVGEGFQVDAKITFQSKEGARQVAFVVQSRPEKVFCLVPCGQPVSQIP